MFTGRHAQGSVEVVCGSMFSGKTEELMRRLRRAQIGKLKVQVFKPVIDNRYSDSHVQSHDANRLIAIPVKSSQELLLRVEPNCRVVGIDEVQFFDNDIIKVAQTLAYRGIRVIAAGLDMDFRGEPFGCMPELLCTAESVTKLNAVCMVCGGIASRTQRLVSDATTEDQVVVGGRELYEARCRFCHEPRAIQHEQLSLLPLQLKPGQNSDSTNQKKEQNQS